MLCEKAALLCAGVADNELAIARSAVEQLVDPAQLKAALNTLLKALHDKYADTIQRRTAADSIARMAREIEALLAVDGPPAGAAVALEGAEPDVADLVERMRRLCASSTAGGAPADVVSAATALRVTVAELAAAYRATLLVVSAQQRASALWRAKQLVAFQREANLLVELMRNLLGRLPDAFAVQSRQDVASLCNTIAGACNRFDESAAKIEQRIAQMMYLARPLLAPVQQLISKTAELLRAASAGDQRALSASANAVSAAAATFSKWKCAGTAPPRPPVPLPTPLPAPLPPTSTPTMPQSAYAVQPATDQMKQMAEDARRKQIERKLATAARYEESDRDGGSAGRGGSGGSACGGDRACVDSAPDAAGDDSARARQRDERDERGGRGKRKQQQRDVGTPTPPTPPPSPPQQQLGVDGAQLDGDSLLQHPPPQQQEEGQAQCGGVGGALPHPLGGQRLNEALAESLAAGEDEADGDVGVPPPPPTPTPTPLPTPSPPPQQGVDGEGEGDSSQQQQPPQQPKSQQQQEPHPQLGGQKLNKVLAELLADAAAAAPPPCLDLLVVDVKAIAPSVEARARLLALVGSEDSVQEAAGVFAQALRDWAALQPRAARVLFLATIDPANKKSGQLVCGFLRKLFVQARRAGAVLPSPSSQIGWLCTSAEFNAAIDSALTGTGAEVFREMPLKVQIEYIPPSSSFCATLFSHQPCWIHNTLALSM